MTWYKCKNGLVSGWYSFQFHLIQVFLIVPICVILDSQLNDFAFKEW